MGEHSPHHSDPFNEKHHAYEEPASPSRAYIPSNRDPEKFTRQDTYPSISCGTQSSDRLSAVRVWENMPDSQHKGEGLAKILVCWRYQTICWWYSWHTLPTDTPLIDKSTRRCCIQFLRHPRHISHPHIRSDTEDRERWNIIHRSTHKSSRSSHKIRIASHKHRHKSLLKGCTITTSTDRRPHHITPLLNRCHGSSMDSRHVLDVHNYTRRAKSETRRRSRRQKFCKMGQKIMGKMAVTGFMITAWGDVSISILPQKWTGDSEDTRIQTSDSKT